MRTQPTIMKLALAAILLSPMALGACSVMDGRQSAGSYTDDAEISTKVRSKIVADDDLKLRQIDVETLKGVVQLSGFVTTMAEKTKAGKVAADTDGVKSVKNNIVIR